MTSPIRGLTCIVRILRSSRRPTRGKAVDAINRVVAEATDVPRTVCIQTIEHTMEPRVVLILAIVLLHAVLVKENI